jgi:hypothetical protein
MPVDRDNLHRILQAKAKVETRPRKKRSRMPNEPRSYGTGLAAYRKTIAGLLTPIVTYVLSRWAAGLPPEVIAPVVGLLTGVAVYVTPNSYVSKSYGTG